MNQMLSFFRQLEANGIHLNQKQIEAVRQNVDPLLVTAGAGSGKTLLLVSKIAYLIKALCIAPERILVLTYTKKASEELRSRLRGLNIHNSIMACTIHSLCFKILRQNTPDKFKLLVHENTRIAIIKQVLKDLGLTSQFQPEDALLQLSCIKNKLQRLDSDHQLYAVYKKYNAYLADNKLLDFDRILHLTYNMLISNPKLLNLVQNRFQYILVDEIQDITLIQMRIIQMIAALHNNVCGVGDFRQTIFSFCGADINIILNFDKYFSSAAKINLTTNYRSTANIIGFADQMIKQCKSIPVYPSTVTNGIGTKSILLEPYNQEDEAQQVVQHIQEAIKSDKYNYQDFAILYRSFNSARAIHERLLIENIPFLQTGYQSIIYEHEVIKPLIDHLYLSLDPNNVNALSSIIPTLYLSKINTMLLMLTV